MDRQEIQELLTIQYGAFLALLRQMPDMQAHMAAPGKWSPAQQTEHLVKSVRPVTLAFGLPKFILPLLFGRSNRPGRSYDELVIRYKTKLAAGGRASRPFVPGTPTNLKSLYLQLERTVNKLGKRVNRFSEDQLDTLMLPHPLLGKLTLREMLYFTAYHARHHQESIHATHITE